MDLVRATAAEDFDAIRDRGAEAHRAHHEALAAMRENHRGQSEPGS